MPLFSRRSPQEASPPRRRAIDGGAADGGRAPASPYKRGRTLAGSTGYTLRQADPRALSNATPREKVHHLSSLRRRLTLILSLSVVVIVLLLAFLQQFTAAVNLTLAQTGDQASKQAYTATIQEYLNQNPLERLRFNLDAHRLTEFVVAAHPEVAQVDALGYAGPVASGFEITQRKPVVSWQVGDKQYYVDANGVSFTKNAFAQPAVKIVDNSGVEHTPGTAIASARFLTFVGQTVALADGAGFKVTAVTIPAGTSRQVALTIDGHAYPVIMSIDRSAGEQVEDMGRILAYFDKQGRKPQYVDLRVKGKAFFRE